MKIIHCADIHIGSGFKNLSDEKSKIRKRELTDTFVRMTDYARENGVRAVIIAGDFFDRSKILRSAKKEIMDKIAGLPEIDFIYLRGNHDSQFEITDEDELEIPKNLIRFDGAPWQYLDYETVRIAGIETAKQPGEAFYETLNFSDGMFNIAVMHGEQNIIRLDRLRGKNIDYLALGDRHIPDTESRKLDSRGIFGYSGCLEGRAFDETGDKGFFLLTIDKGKLAKREFVPIAKRKHVIAEVDITNCDGHYAIENAIKEKITALNKDDLIRVVLKGKYKADINKETANLESKFDGSFFHFEIKDESALDRDSVDYANEISLRNKFVELVNNSGLGPELMDKIIECGLKALRGEELDL